MLLAIVGSMDNPNNQNECSCSCGNRKGEGGHEAGEYHQWDYLNHSLLIRRTRDFSVGLDQQGRLDWATSEEYDNRKHSEETQEETRAREAVMAAIAVVETTPCTGITDGFRQDFKRLLGEALVCCFEDALDSAMQMVEAAKLYIQARNEEISRHWYLHASVCAAVPFMVVATILWIGREFATQLLGDRVFWLSLCMCAGAVGALLSVIARSGKLKFDACAGRLLHRWEATSRIVAGAIAALVVSLAIYANLVFGAFVVNGNLHVILLLAALASGAGERLATSIITKFDDTHPDLKNLEKDLTNTKKGQ